MPYTRKKKIDATHRSMPKYMLTYKDVTLSFIVCCPAVTRFWITSIPFFTSHPPLTHSLLFSYAKAHPSLLARGF